MPTSVNDQLAKGPDQGRAAAVQPGTGAGRQRQFHAAVEKSFDWRRTLLHTCMFLPLAVLVLEGFFNMAGIGQGEIVKPDLQMGTRHIPGKLVTWRLEGYSHGKFSSAGLRDIEHALVKPAGVKRIVFLGDSYTEGLQVAMEDVFARRVQEILNLGRTHRFETLNFGCSGYSTGQEVLQFDQEAAQYKPDLVVLLYTPGDTLENCVSPSKRHEADPRPYFYLDQNRQLKQDNGVLTLNYEKLRPRPLSEFLRRYSTIFGAYTQTNLSLKMSDKVYFRLTRLLSQIAARASAIMGRSGKNQPPAGLIPPSWAEPDQLGVSEALILKLEGEVRAAGGKLVVMALPDIANADPLYVKARRRLAILAQTNNFGYLDLSEAFARDKNPNNLFVKVHFSKMGHDLTARELSAYLRKAGYLSQ